ncbi:hypothetical protein FHS95_001937 [Sphingomonas naasensis]|uniref:hypothetical protein n=1 Tax=Sphingomonas naasensis TaxID=1344951 RepID=UPI00141AC376|nr:hypothetical protein [Sphingomonas naasensis]NIJ20245.1 hypothetical protein [Sphingomonas naasensis]
MIQIDSGLRWSGAASPADILFLLRYPAILKRGRSKPHANIFGKPQAPGWRANRCISRSGGRGIAPNCAVALPETGAPRQRLCGAPLGT